MRHDIRQLTEQLREENFIPNSFIEIGSRDGHDTNYICYYWKLNPNNCYIIEAHPKCYEFIQNTYPQYNSFNIAASNKTKVVKFNAGIFGEEENIGISSLLDMNIGSFISEQIEVDAWRMDEVMGHFNIDKFDFMKIDVEGFGFEVLQGFSDKIKQTKYIQIELEVSQVWENQSCYDDVVNYLKNQGFEILDEIDLDGTQKDVLFKNINL